MLAEERGSDLLQFYYSGGGIPVAFNLNGVVYYYQTNSRGDVTGIYDANGTLVVQYTYDAWGNPTGITGSMADTVGQMNPLRYRGYYYDAETGFYYLQSRYYDPTVGRFINADGFVSTGQGLLAHNMYSYCRNNPINRYDPNGNCDINIDKNIVYICRNHMQYYNDPSRLVPGRKYVYPSEPTGKGWKVKSSVSNTTTSRIDSGGELKVTVTYDVLSSNRAADGGKYVNFNKVSLQVIDAPDFDHGSITISQKSVLLPNQDYVYEFDSDAGDFDVTTLNWDPVAISNVATIGIGYQLYDKSGRIISSGPVVNLSNPQSLIDKAFKTR